MPFGRSKKDAVGDDLDAKKSSLFGGRSGNSSKSKLASTSTPQPSSANPYASAPSAASANPYASPSAGNDPYAPAPPTAAFDGMSLGGPPPGYSSGGGGLPRREEKTPVPPGGYGGAPRFQGSSGDSRGAGSGYGGDAYGSGAGQSRYGANGYGGLGRSNSGDTMSTDAGRNALFGDAPQRLAQKGPEETRQQDGSNGDGYGNGSSGAAATGGYDSTEMPGGYGAVEQQQELTAEEQEEQDVAAAKQEIRFIKQQDVAATRNARRVAEQSEQVGRETLARLGQQGERIHNTERNLDMASNQNRLAEEKARELRTLNRSMFAVHVANPFTAKRREVAANAIALDKHQRERAVADATRSEAYGSQARAQAQQRDLNGNPVRQSGSQRNLADRAKYQFEADSEDEEMENEIDDNLDAIHRGAKTLHQLGKAMGAEVQSQNKHLDRITKKTDKVDDQLAVNRARLDRIR